MAVVVLGIDLGKNVCSLAGLDETGAVVLRRRMKRDGVIDFVAKMPALIVAMEACCGAHHLGRVQTGKGHTIRLMSPEYVRPYVKANKNEITTPRHRRSRDAADHALLPGQERRAVGHPVPASGALAIGVAAHGSDQPSARPAAGARHRRGAGAAQAGRCSQLFADEEDGRLSPRMRQLVEDGRRSRHVSASRPILERLQG